MVKMLLALLPRKYKAVYMAGLSLFAAVDTWDEVEELAAWIAKELADTEHGGVLGKFNGVARWGKLGGKGKLNVIGPPKRKAKRTPSLPDG